MFSPHNHISHGWAASRKEKQTSQFITYRKVTWHPHRILAFFHKIPFTHKTTIPSLATKFMSIHMFFLSALRLHFRIVDLVDYFCFVQKKLLLSLNFDLARRCSHCSPAHPTSFVLQIKKHVKDCTYTITG